MAKTIQEMAMDYASEKWEGEHFTVAFCDSMEDFLKGENAVLEEIEDYLENYTLPKDSLLKFCILDVLADMGLYVKQLKGE